MNEITTQNVSTYIDDRGNQRELHGKIDVEKCNFLKWSKLKTHVFPESWPIIRRVVAPNFEFVETPNTESMQIIMITYNSDTNSCKIRAKQLDKKAKKKKKM